MSLRSISPDALFAAVEERQIASMPWYDDYNRCTRRDTTLYAPKPENRLGAVPCRACGKPVTPEERTSYGRIHRECYNAEQREKRRDYFREYARQKAKEAKA